MTYKEYNKCIDTMVEKIFSAIKGGAVIKTVYGVPRGGYYAAIRVANALKLLVIADPSEITSFTLIVDDICDSGSTIKKYDGKQTAVVLVKEDAPVKPTFYGEILTEDTWVEFPDENGATIEDNIIRILEYIGENPKRTGLLGTPDRIKRMYGEIFRGYDKSKKPKITTFPNGEDDLTYDNMVIDEGGYYSMCEHHMMPFFGHYWFAYIPNPKGRILGISKIGRVVDYCAAKLQVQERLTHEIVDMLYEALGDENPPLGIALVMKGTHLCKTMRGARKEGTMTSSYLTGAFKDDNALRAEFMNFVQNGK